MGIVGVLVALDRQEKVGEPGSESFESGLSAIQQVEKNHGFPVRSVASLENLVGFIEKSGSTSSSGLDGAGGEGHLEDKKDCQKYEPELIGRMKKYREEYGV